MNKVFAAILFCFGFLFGEKLYANCVDFQFLLNPSSYAFGTTFGSPIQLGINITKQNAVECTYFVTFSKGGAGSYDRKLLNMGSTLSYQIYKNSPNINILMDLPEATTADQVIQRTISVSSRSDVVSYYVNMPEPVAYSGFGLYSDSVVVKAYEGVVGGGGPLLASQTLFLTYNMTRQIDISIGPPGFLFDIGSVFQNLDFGTFETGETRAFDVVAKYNAGYALYVSSAQAGRLKSSVGNSLIPYTLKVNGVPVNLSSGQALIASGSGSSSPQGTRFSGLVTIGAVEDNLAGSYSDSLQFSVVSTE